LVIWQSPIATSCYEKKRMLLARSSTVDSLNTIQAHVLKLGNFLILQMDRFLAAYNGSCMPLDGWRWCLPAEDCWEWAARSDSGFPYPWGKQFDSAKCNRKESGIGGPTPVDKYKTGRSPAGLRDMAGNLWEFLESSYPNERGVVLRRILPEHRRRSA
jgi:hypothetical protein